MTTHKETVLTRTKELVNEKLNELKQSIQLIQEASADESKQTAGDKHETAKAMAQLEMEKLMKQLQVLLEQQNVLKQINLSTVFKKVALGALVRTNTMNYFIAVAAGKIELPEITFYVISPQSPIGMLLLGNEVGSEISFNNNKQQIIEMC